MSKPALSNAGDTAQAQKVAWVEKPQRIACGFYHSAAVGQSTEAWVWGRNQYNIHGRKVKSDDRRRDEEQQEGKRELLPYRNKKFGHDVHEVHCGTNHTVFLKRNQSSVAFGYEVYTTGLGNQGRLGVGPGSLSGGGEEEDQEMVELDIWWSRSGPIKTIFPWASGTRALHVACGADHTLCLATDGHVYAWGVNTHGQCGTDSAAPWHRKPVQVKLPKDHGMVSHMAAGAQHSLAIIDGVVFSWGNGRNGRLGTSSSEDCRRPIDIELTHENRMTFVAGGEAHSGAIDKRGRVFMWGAGDSGRLGFPESLDVLEPKLVWSFETMTASGVSMKALALGGFHTLFLEASPTSGNMYSCGSGAAVGHLMEGERRCVSVPLQLHLPGKAVQIAAGMFHSMALLEKGQMVSWGVGAHGRLGQGGEANVWQPKLMAGSSHEQENQFVPHEVQEDADANNASHIDDAKLAYVVAELSCGSTHVFARTHGGFLYGWGCDSSGQLGFGGEEAQMYHWVPKQLDFGRMVKQVCCGHEFTLAVTMSEELWSWGRGFEGQLGLGYCGDAATPCQVPNLERVQTVAAGETHSAAIVQVPTGERMLYTWGSSDSGVLGLGRFITSGPLHTPTQVEFLDEHGPAANPLFVRCGANSTAVVCGQGGPAETENTLWTFGNGWYGRLGLGSQESRSSPARVKLPKTTGVRELSLGVDHAAIITLQDELYAWGKGPLLGEVQNVLQPKHLLIEGSTHFKFVECGEQETFVIDKAGHVHAWGSNRSGQLGLGQQSGLGSFVSTPTHVKPLHEPVTGLVSGGSFTIASLESGDVCAWGNQTCGRLGLVETKERRICWEPSLVVATWSTAATAARPQQTRKAMRSSKETDSEAGRTEKTQETTMTASKGTKHKTQNVVSFVILQTVLKQEDANHQIGALKAYAEELEQAVQNLIRDIRGLDQAEEGLRHKIEQLSDSVVTSLRWWPNVTLPNTASPLVDERMPKLVPTYGRMLWILQQQPVYLAQLSLYMRDEDTMDTFLDTIHALYGDTADPRCQHLFNSLLKIMISKEAENAGHEKEFLKKGSMSFKVFSRQALLQAFAKQVMHPFLGSKSKDLPQESILELVGAISSSAASAAFCLSYSDFKENKLGPEDKSKEEVELKNLYTIGLNSFRQFLMEKFLPVVKSMDLPMFMRLALRHVANAAGRWKDAASLQDIDSDLRQYLPALRLFIYGVVEPLLRDSMQFAVPAFFLKKTANDFKPDEPQTAMNLEAIADFLDQMLCNSIDPKEKALTFAAKSLKEELLGFIRDQCSVEDTTGPDLLGAVLKAHFSREQCCVTMSQAQIMKLSNLLKEYSSKLRIKEHDELDACCQKAPNWEKEVIMISERYDVLFNFRLNCRFMLESEDIALCLQSMCPLPAWACSSQTSPLLVNVDEEAGASEQGAFFESLFRRLPPVQSKSFQQLRDECIAQKAQLTSTEGNLQLVNDLDKAVQQITELIDVSAEPKELLDNLAERVRSRQQRFRYLEVVERNVKAAVAAKLQYQQELKRAAVELKGALDFALTKKLPPTLQKECNKSNVTPFFQALAKRLEAAPPIVDLKFWADESEMRWLPDSGFSSIQIHVHEFKFEIPRSRF